MYPDPLMELRRMLEERGLRVVRTPREWQLRRGGQVLARAPELQQLKRSRNLAEILRGEITT